MTTPQHDLKCKPKSNPTNPRDDIGQSHRCLKCRYEKLLIYSIAALGWLLVLVLYFALTATPAVVAPSIQLSPVSSFSQTISSLISSSSEQAKGEDTIRTGGN